MNSRQIIQFLLLPLLLLSVTGSTAFSQDDDTEDPYDMSDVPVDDQARLAYIGFGGGYIATPVLMDYDALNTGVNQPLGLDDFDGPLLLQGGGGLVAVAIIPNLRIGAFGMSGTKEIQATVDVQGTGYTRMARFNTGILGFQFDYAIMLTDAFGIFPGVMAGPATYTLTVAQTAANGVNFGTLYDPSLFDGTPETNTAHFNRYARVENDHFFFYPAVALEYAFSDFLMVRAAGGYSIHTDNNWHDAMGTEVSEAPDITADGPTFQVGLFLGLFQN